MKTFLALLLILVTVAACSTLVHAQSRSTLIRRSQDRNGVHVTYLIEGSSSPVIVVTGGSKQEHAVETSTGYAATVNATLQPCYGSLAVDGVVIVPPLKCAYLPQVVRR